MTEPTTEHQIGCSDTTGREYRTGVYHPLEDDSLPDAPEADGFPLSAHRLPQAMRPGLCNRFGLLWAATLWGWFSAEQISRVTLDRLGSSSATIETIAYHPIRIVIYLL